MLVKLEIFIIIIITIIYLKMITNK